MPLPEDNRKDDPNPTLLTPLTTTNPYPTFSQQSKAWMELQNEKSPKKWCGGNLYGEKGHSVASLSYRG